MEIEDLSRVLREHPFLSELEPQHIATVVGCASNRRYAAGEFLCRQGEQADVFYLVREGLVAVELHTPQGGVRIDTVNEGDVLGWSWLIAPYQWHFDARAVRPVRAIVLDAKCLRNKSEQDHDLGYHLLKTFSGLMEQRLQAARLQLLDIYGKGKEAPARARQ